MISMPSIQTIRLGAVVIQVWGLFVFVGIIMAYLLAKKRFIKKKLIYVM